MSTDVREVDLRKPEAWTDFVDPAGRINEQVIVSWCGRYTVVHYPAVAGYPESFTAFRRHAPPQEYRYSPPSWCEGAKTLLQAIGLCADHAEREGAR